MQQSSSSTLAFILLCQCTRERGFTVHNVHSTCVTKSPVSAKDTALCSAVVSPAPTLVAIKHHAVVQCIVHLNVAQARIALLHARVGLIQR